MTKVLLAEDDLNLGKLLQEFLIAKAYEVELAKNGQEALALYQNNTYHICILDVMMPLMDGFTLAKEIRKKDTQIPIIFLTVNALKKDVINGLTIGADDYITKPFNMEELLLRMDAVLRRSGVNVQKNIQWKIGKYFFDYEKQTLSFESNVQKLSGKENELLFLFCQNQGKVLDRSFMLKEIWGNDDYFTGRSMDVYIAKLRKYLKNDPSIEILNVHGIGYKITF
jgi:two-component system OmpR family response regulator